MSVVQLWGTGIAPTPLQRRITSAGDLRVDSEGNVRVASVAPAQVIFLRVTSQGDQRVTSEGDRRVTIDGITGPQYFETDNVPTDGGEPFELLFETAPWQPAAQGGENTFHWAYLTFSWSMAGTIQVTPVVDGSSAAVTLADGSVVSVVPSTFTLAQQTGNLNRVSQMFPVPLVRRIVRGGAEVARYSLRGERIAFLIESTGPLGVGELMLEGVEVESEAVRKAEYATVTTN